MNNANRVEIAAAYQEVLDNQRKLNMAVLLAGGNPAPHAGRNALGGVSYRCHSERREVSELRYRLR